MKTIITESDSFSILGIVKGTVVVTIKDDGSDVFRADVKVDTNKGSGSTSIDLSGNDTISKSVAGIKVTAEITKWNCTANHLSFHLKANAKKGIIKKTVFNKGLSGDR